MHLILQLFLKTKILASPIKANKLINHIKNNFSKMSVITLDFNGIEGATFSFLTTVFNSLASEMNSIKLNLANLPKNILNQIDFLKES